MLQDAQSIVTVLNQVSGYSILEKYQDLTNELIFLKNEGVGDLVTAQKKPGTFKFGFFHSILLLNYVYRKKDLHLLSSFPV